MLDGGLRGKARFTHPTENMNAKTHPHLLEPKRSVLAGLVKFLAVGCGLNEFSPSANIESNILADSMATYLKPQACSPDSVAR